MLSREEIIQKIIEDEAVTASLMELSRTHDMDKLHVAFPHYFKACAALATVVNDMGLTTTNTPPDAVGVAKLLPLVTIGMPGFNDGFVSHWGDQYLKMTGVPEVFYEEAGHEARAKGEGGEPNYLHGLLVLDLIGDLIVQMAGTHLMMAAAFNMEKGLQAANGDFKA